MNDTVRFFLMWIELYVGCSAAVTIFTIFYAVSNWRRNAP